MEKEIERNKREGLCEREKKRVKGNQEKNRERELLRDRNRMRKRKRQRDFTREEQ